MFEKSVNIVELENGSARLLSLQKKDKNAFRVVRAAEYTVSEFSKMPLRGSVTVILPREKCVVRTLKIEAEGAALLAEIQKESEEGLPFEKEKALWDSAVMSQSGGTASVFFSAVSSDQVKNLLKPVAALEKRAVMLAPSTVGLYELLRQSGAVKSGNCLAVYLSKERFDIMAAGKETVLFSRGALFAEEPDVAAAVKAAVESLSRSGVVLAEVYSNSAELNGKLEKTGLKTILLSLPPGLAAELKAAGVQPERFGLCAGTAFAVTGHGRLKIDLNRNSARVGRSGDMLALVKKVSFAVSALFVLLSAVFFIMAKSAEKQVIDLRTGLSSMGGLSGRSWSRVLVDISKAVPSEVILNELTSDNRGDITARGTSVTRQGVTTFLENLNKLQGYSAELAFANDAGAGTRLSVQFQMKIRQRGEK